MTFNEDAPDYPSREIRMALILHSVDLEWLNRSDLWRDMVFEFKKLGLL